MIGALPAMAVRHERRKKKQSVFSGILPEGVPARPAKLIFKPHGSRDNHATGAAEASTASAGADADMLTSPAGPSAASAPGRLGSRAASLAHATSPQQDGCGGSAAGGSRQGTPTHKATRYRYGDECCYGKVSLLHFLTFFLLGGLTFVVVGAVQFKKDAGFSNFRYHFLVLGFTFLAVGVLLVVIKCVWFRIAYPIVAYVDEDGSVNIGSKLASPAVEKKEETTPSPLQLPPPPQQQQRRDSVSAAAEKKKREDVAEKAKNTEEKKRLLV